MTSTMKQEVEGIAAPACQGEHIVCFVDLQDLQ